MAGKKGAGGKPGRSGRKKGEAFGTISRGGGRKREYIPLRVPPWPTGFQPAEPAVAYATLYVEFCPHCGASWFDGGSTISWRLRAETEPDVGLLAEESLSASEEWHKPGCVADK